MPLLQVRVRVFVPRAPILELRVEPRLHLGLLKQHPLSDLVDCLLVLDGHSIGDAADFVPGLRQVSLHVLSLALAVRKTRIQLGIHLTDLSIRLTGFLQLTRQVLFEQLVVCLAEGQAEVSQGLELVGLHNRERGISPSNASVEDGYEFRLRCHH